MRIGKIALMSGVAAMAMVAAGGARAADANNSSGADKPLVLAQNALPPSSNTMSNAELAARLQAVEDQLAAQQDRAQSDRTRLSTLEQGYNSAVWNFDNGRATFASGDNRFTLAIRARMQADFAGFSQDTPGSHPSGFAGPQDLSSGAVMRRAYFGIEGRAFNDFWYELRLNAGGSDGGQNPTCTATSVSTQAAPAGGAITTTSTCAIGSIQPGGEGDPLLNKMAITYIGIPWWHFNVGVIEPSFMMEGTTSSANLIWMERPALENIAADSFGAGDSRRGIEMGWSRPDTFWAGDNTAFDVAFTVTEASAAKWFATTGLTLDKRGFFSLDPTLQTSDPLIFAAGDCGTVTAHPRPKAGVFAVRQGPPLAANLRRVMLGQKPEPFEPQRRFLSLIGTGDGRAIATRAGWSIEGTWVWRWKDYIDRKWMRMYCEPPKKAEVQL